MAQVISFSQYTPAARFDATVWTHAQIEESAEAYDTAAEATAGTWTIIDTIPFTDVVPPGADPDPADPLARSFTTELASDTMDLWYRVVFLDATTDSSQPTVPVQNSIGTVTASTPYATVTELARILKIRSATSEQTAAMERVLLTAAGEIDREIDATTPLSATWELALAEQVNLDRAADLWWHAEARTGFTGLIGEDSGVSSPGRYSWERYAQRLAPLKQQWGLA